MISESDMTPEERYNLFKRLCQHPDVQAAALRDRIVRNVTVEGRWNSLIDAVDRKLQGLDTIIKIVPHDTSGNRLTEYEDEVDLRAVIRKALFEKKQRMVADRDRELSQT